MMMEFVDSPGCGLATSRRRLGIPAYSPCTSRINSAEGGADQDGGAIFRRQRRWELGLDIDVSYRSGA